MMNFTHESLDDDVLEDVKMLSRIMQFLSKKSLTKNILKK